MALHIILASHGLYAQEALNATKMIIGEPRMETHVVSVTQGRSLDECYAELSDIVEGIPESDEVLILVDMFGGTPSNIASMLLIDHDTDVRIQAYAGLNLPMLIEILATNPETIVLARELVTSSYRNALVDINEKQRGVDQDGFSAL